MLWARRDREVGKSESSCLNTQTGTGTIGISWNGIDRVGGVEGSIILGRNEKDTTRDSSNT